MTNPITTGPATPTTPLRVTTDSSTAIEVNASTAGNSAAVLASTKAAHLPGRISEPDRPIIDARLTKTMPATRLDTISKVTAAMVKTTAAATLPTKISPRRRDLVRMVRQVP